MKLYVYGIIIIILISSCMMAEYEDVIEYEYEINIENNFNGIDIQVIEEYNHVGIYVQNTSSSFIIRIQYFINNSEMNIYKSIVPNGKVQLYYESMKNVDDILCKINLLEFY